MRPQVRLKLLWAPLALLASCLLCNADTQRPDAAELSARIDWAQSTLLEVQQVLEEARAELRACRGQCQARAPAQPWRQAGAGGSAPMHGAAASQAPFGAYRGPVSGGAAPQARPEPRTATVRAEPRFAPRAPAVESGRAEAAQQSAWPAASHPDDDLEYEHDDYWPGGDARVPQQVAPPGASRPAELVRAQPKEPVPWSPLSDASRAASQAASEVAARVQHESFEHVEHTPNSFRRSSSFRQSSVSSSGGTDSPHAPAALTTAVEGARGAAGSIFDGVRRAAEHARSSAGGWLGSAGQSGSQAPEEAGAFERPPPVQQRRFDTSHEPPSVQAAPGDGAAWHAPSGRRSRLGGLGARRRNPLGRLKERVMSSGLVNGLVEKAKTHAGPPARSAVQHASDAAGLVRDGMGRAISRARTKSPATLADERHLAAAAGGWRNKARAPLPAVVVPFARSLPDRVGRLAAVPPVQVDAPSAPGARYVSADSRRSYAP